MFTNFPEHKYGNKQLIIHITFDLKHTHLIDASTLTVYYAHILTLMQTRHMEAEYILKTVYSIPHPSLLMNR